MNRKIDCRASSAPSGMELHMVTEWTCSDVERNGRRSSTEKKKKSEKQNKIISQAMGELSELKRTKAKKAKSSQDDTV